MFLIYQGWATLRKLPQVMISLIVWFTYYYLNLFEILSHKYVISIKTLVGLFITSFFNPNIYNICRGIYLTASTLEHQLTWWVGDKLLLMDLFSLVLLWLYMAEINSTIPVDYCNRKKSLLIYRVSWYFSTSYIRYNYHWRMNT